MTPVIHKDVKVGDLFQWKKDKQLIVITAPWSGAYGETHRYTVYNPDGTLWISLAGNGCNIAGNITNNDEIIKINRKWHFEEYNPNVKGWDKAKKIVFD